MAHNNNMNHNSVNWPQYLQQQANQQQHQQQHQQQRMMHEQQRMLHQQQEQQRMLQQQHEQQKLFQQQKQYQQQQLQLQQDVKPPIAHGGQFYPATIDLTQMYDAAPDNDADAEISRRIMMIDHLLNTYGGDNPRGQADYDFPLAMPPPPQPQPQPQPAQPLPAPVPAPTGYQPKYKSKRGRRPKYCPPAPSTNVNINMDMPSTTYNAQNQPFLPTVNNINVQTQNFNLPIFPQPVNYPYTSNSQRSTSVKITELSGESSKLPELPLHSPSEPTIKTEIVDTDCDALIIDEDAKPEESGEDAVVDGEQVKQEEGGCSKRAKFEYPEVARKQRSLPRLTLPAESQEQMQAPSLQEILNKSFTTTIASAQGQLNLINRANIMDFVRTGQQILIELIQHCEEVHKIFKSSTNLSDNQMKVQTHLRCIRLLTQNIQLVFRKCCESSSILDFGNLDDGLMNRLLNFVDCRDMSAGFDERFRDRMQILMRNTELREVLEKLKTIINDFNARYRE